MAHDVAPSPRPAVRLHWRAGRVRSVSVPTVDAPPFHPLPARAGVVGHEGLAVNDAVLVRAGLASPPPVPGPRWRWQLAALPGSIWQWMRRVASLRAPAFPTASVGRGLCPAAVAHRWPVAWPYADCGLGGFSNTFPSGSPADHLPFAPDVIVDSSGRILRL